LEQGAVFQQRRGDLPRPSHHKNQHPLIIYVLQAAAVQAATQAAVVVQVVIAKRVHFQSAQVLQ
jgi:hypothetical protein